MKIWIKLLIGIILGLIIGFLVNTGNSVENLLGYLSRLFIQIGRYVIFPMVFFSLVMGTYELKREKKLFRVYGKILVYLLGSTIILVIIGILSVVIFSPERIPIITEKEKQLQIYGIKEVFLHIFPSNLFKVFVEPGNFMLPLVFLSFFLGVNMDFDKQLSRPALQFFDSMSRTLYHANSLIVELFGIAAIGIISYRVVYFRNVNMEIFKQLLIILLFDTLFVVFAVYPALLHLLGDRVNPYRWLYASLASLVTALVTGDEYLSVGMLSKHGKESMGVKRSVGTAVYPIFALFGRAGTAMVTSVSFILILRSYSSLELSFMQYLWVGLFSLLTSFFLFSVPGMGAFVSLAFLSSYYGKGLEDGYLILRPVIPLLVSAGVMVDVLTSSLVSFLIGKSEGLSESGEIENFI